MQGEAAGPDGEAVGTYSEDPDKMTDEGGHTKQIFNVNKTDLYCKKMPSRPFITTENSTPGFKTVKRQVDSLIKD